MVYKQGWKQELRPRFAVIGLEARTKNADEMNPATSKIGPLWRRFMTDKPTANLPDRKNPGTPVAVYTRYESDHTGEYTIVVGEEVELVEPRGVGGLTKGKSVEALVKESDDFGKGGAIVERWLHGLVQVTVPDAFYLRFDAKGQMPQALVQAWGEIWAHFGSGAKPGRAFSADYEVHKPDGSVEIYVAISLGDAANRTLMP